MYVMFLCLACGRMVESYQRCCRSLEPVACDVRCFSYLYHCHICSSNAWLSTVSVDVVYVMSMVLGTYTTNVDLRMSVTDQPPIALPLSSCLPDTVQTNLINYSRTCMKRHCMKQSPSIKRSSAKGVNSLNGFDLLL